MKTLKSESSIFRPIVQPRQDLTHPGLFGAKPSSYHVHVALLVNPPPPPVSLFLVMQNLYTIFCTLCSMMYWKWIMGLIIGGGAALVTCITISRILCRWFWMRTECRRATVLCTLRPRSLQTWPSRRSTACCWMRRKCESLGEVKF